MSEDERRTIRLADPRVLVGRGGEVVLMGTASDGRHRSVSMFTDAATDVQVEATALKIAAQQAGELVIRGRAVEGDDHLYVADAARAGSKELFGEAETSDEGIFSGFAARISGRAARETEGWRDDMRAGLDAFENGGRARDVSERTDAAAQRRATAEALAQRMLKGPAALEADAVGLFMHERASAGR